MQKTATLENFQRVRGMLRLLAQTVGQLWREQPRASAIHLHHLDPGNERIRLEISTKLAQHAFIPAVRADVSRGWLPDTFRRPVATEWISAHGVGREP